MAEEISNSQYGAGHMATNSGSGRFEQHITYIGANVLAAEHLPTPPEGLAVPEHLIRQVKACLQLILRQQNIRPELLSSERNSQTQVSAARVQHQDQQSCQQLTYFIGLCALLALHQGNLPAIQAYLKSEKDAPRSPTDIIVALVLLSGLLFTMTPLREIWQPQHLQVMALGKRFDVSPRDWSSLDSFRCFLNVRLQDHTYGNMYIQQILRQQRYMMLMRGEQGLAIEPRAWANHVRHLVEGRIPAFFAIVAGLEETCSSCGKPIDAHREAVSSR